jgi:hypothetical protein
MPSVRQFVLEEMENMDEPADNNDLQDLMQQPTVSHLSITDKIKHFLTGYLTTLMAYQLPQTASCKLAFGLVTFSFH